MTTLNTNSHKNLERPVNGDRDLILKKTDEDLINNLDNTFYRFDEKLLTEKYASMNYISGSTLETHSDEEYIAKFNFNNNNNFFVFDTITKVEKIWGWLYGAVYKLETIKGNHKRYFAMKDYWYVDAIQKRRQILNAYANYLLAKKAKMRVFPTMRINAQNNTLLMTLWSNEDFFLQSKDEKISELHQTNMINDLDWFIEKLVDNIQKSVVNWLYIGSDSYFFLINKKKPADLDFVIGDFDMNDVSRESRDRLLDHNVAHTKNAIHFFMDQYITSEENRLKIQEEIYKKLDDFKNGYTIELNDSIQ